MEYRADIGEIREYIERFTEAIAPDMVARGLNMTCTKDTSSNIRLLTSKFRDVAEDFPTDVRIVEEKEGIDRRRAVDQFDELETGAGYMHKPDHRIARNFLRYCFVFGFARYSDPLDGGGWTSTVCDYQMGMKYRLQATINYQDGKFSAEIMWKTRRTENGEARYAPLYSVVPLKLTKFLKKMGMTDKFITAVANKVSNKKMTLSLHLTDKYIPESYIELDNVASSCMSKDASDFGLPPDEHPTLAYEGMGHAQLLGLIKDESSTKDFPYIARVMINMKNLKYNCVYGLDTVTDPTDFGLHRGSMYGIEMKVIHSYSGGILAPYVDGTDCVYTIEGDVMHPDDDGDHHSSYNTGRLSGSIRCECCDERVDEVRDTDDFDEVCEDCISEYYVWSSYHDNYTREDRAQEVKMSCGDTDWVNPDEVYTVYSEANECYLLEDDAEYDDELEDYVLV